MLNFRKLEPALGGTTVADILAAIAAGLAEATNAEGEPRTPGSGSAWSALPIERGGDPLDVIGYRLIPPDPAVSDLRVLLIGAADITTGSPSPTLIPSESLANDVLYIGVCRGVAEGDWDDWNQSEPYTGCSFTGYGRFYSLASRTIAGIALFESQDSIAIEPWTTTTDNPTYPVYAGALAEVSPGELLYAVAVTGMPNSGDAGMNPSIHSINPQSPSSLRLLFGNHNSGGGSNSWFRGWDAAGTIQGGIVADSYMPVAPGATSFKTVTGKLLPSEIVLQSEPGANKALYGRLRDVYRIGSEFSGTLLTETGTGTPLGYALSGRRSAIANAFFLRY